MGQLHSRGEQDKHSLLGEQGFSLGGLEDLDADRAELVYGLDGWSEDDRSALAARLELLAVPHRWEEGELVISAHDEAWVERIFDQLEDELSLGLEDDVEQVAYDLTGWDAAQREALVEALTDEAIPHEIGGDELFVHEIDEQRADELIDALLGAPAAPGAEPGEPPSELMGELFVAADRLRRDPYDHGAARSLTQAARAAGALAQPYGIDRRWWEETVSEAASLVEMIRGDQPDREAAASAAAGLRDRLRPFV